MAKNIKRNIVISAINFFEGGPLSVLKDCLRYLANNLLSEYNIIALVHKKDLIDIKGIELYEFPRSRKAWSIRLFYEYVYFKKLSLKFDPVLWLSLHDISPRVIANAQAVYCHNPAPFYKRNNDTFLLDPRFALFNLFYKYLYKINIKSNKYIIVQQDWIRKRFKKMYGKNNIIVCYPSITLNNPINSSIKTGESVNEFKFFYPAFPRTFKNIEVICRAVKHLEKIGDFNFEVYLTINGKENKYAKSIYNDYNSLKKIKFIGKLSRQEVFNYYNLCDCLLFPSKLETWGLPISEFKTFNKPMLLSDLPFAHETLGNYDKAAFFDPDKAENLADCMKKIMGNKMEYDTHKAINVDPPFSRNWKELFELLLSESKTRKGNEPMRVLK
jgi:glycosyltransferase involved in cell wall biosynthesis